MKLYIDWNILNGIKNGRYTELKNIIKQSDKFIIIYSSSHISDIVSSYSDKKVNPEIQSDLEFLSEITENMCVLNNDDNIVIQYTNPLDLFKNQIGNRDFLNDFSFNKLTSFADSNIEYIQLIELFTDFIKSFPFEGIFKEALENPQILAVMNAIFPGLEGDLTIEGLFNSIGKMLENMNEKEGYKDFKSLFEQLKINQGKLNDPNNDPYEVITETYQRIGIHSPLEKDFLEKGKYAPKWFDDITSEYINLDMHGFYSDKVKVTDKEKSTFKNTTQDAFHTAFASTCDIYITNDKRNYKKAKAIFKKNNIFTHILNADEFVNFYIENIQNSDFISSWKKFNEAIEFGYFHDIFDNPNEYYKVHFSNFYYFSYFNRIYLFNSGTKENSFSFMFGKQLPTNCLGVFYKEIKEMVKILVNHLGTDNDDLGYFNESEIDENNNWNGRYWNFGEFQYRLVKDKRYFQFYYDFEV